MVVVGVDGGVGAGALGFCRELPHDPARQQAADRRKDHEHPAHRIADERAVDVRGRAFAALEAVVRERLETVVRDQLDQPVERDAEEPRDGADDDAEAEEFARRRRTPQGVLEADHDVGEFHAQALVSTSKNSSGIAAAMSRS